MLIVGANHEILDGGVLLKHNHLIPHFASRDFHLLEVILYRELIIVFCENL